MVQIVDRTKDLVKSGGEWISSVELESRMMGHPKVLEACVIGIPHPKWDERPLACVVPKPEYVGHITKEEIIDYLRPQIPKWWLPDAVLFMHTIPKTSVGKFDKKVLRNFYEAHITSASRRVGGTPLRPYSETCDGMKEKKDGNRENNNDTNTTLTG
jgi:fatty-acyl-CoA synthase